MYVYVFVSISLCIFMKHIYEPNCVYVYMYRTERNGSSESSSLYYHRYLGSS